MKIDSDKLSMYLESMEKWFRPGIDVFIVSSGGEDENSQTIRTHLKDRKWNKKKVTGLYCTLARPLGQVEHKAGLAQAPSSDHLAVVLIAPWV